MAEVFNVADMQNLIRSIVITKIRQTYPNLDVSDNSVYDDLFVKPVVEIYRPIFLQLNSLELMMNLNNAQYMTEAELDEIGLGNYGLQRTPGAKATGVVTVSLSRIPSGDLVVPNGAIFQTDSGLQFQTTSDSTTVHSDLLLLWNASTLTYDVPVSVEAFAIGTSYNVSANQITQWVTKFNNDIKYVKNASAFTDGDDKETNIDYAARIKAYYLSRHLNTKPGYEEEILANIPNVTDIYVVGFGDAEMTRDEVTVIENSVQVSKHIGGKVDIYITGSVLSTISAEHIPMNTGNLRLTYNDASSITVTNLTTPAKNATLQFISSGDLVTIINVNDCSYDSTSVSTIRVSYLHGAVPVVQDFSVGITSITLQTPFDSISRVYRDTAPSSPYSSSYYTITRTKPDGTIISSPTDPYYKSTQELATLTLSMNTLDNGTLVSVDYTVNETLQLIKDYFNVSENRVITSDVLARSANPVYVNIGLSVKMRTGQTLDDTKISLMNSLISTYFSGLTMGGSASEDDIITLLSSNSTIDQAVQYITCPLTSFYVPVNQSDAIISQRDGTVITATNIQYLSLNKTSIVAI